jgi:hypothetical protein
MGKNAPCSTEINMLSVSLVVKFSANSGQHLIGLTQLLVGCNFVIVSPLSGALNLGD